MMRYFFMSVLLMASLQLQQVYALEVATDPDLKHFVDNWMAENLGKYQVRGAAVSIVKDGKVIFAKGYGYTSAEGNRTVEADTVFRIASVSKLFIATAVMQLVEQGKLSLDTDINQYLQGTGIVIPLEYRQPLTLKHLLSHSAGYEESAQGYYEDKSGYKETEVQFLERFQPERIRAPGVISTYSNWTTALAALIVANVSGMPYFEYIEDNIFKPLGMNSTTYLEPLPEALALNMAQPVFQQGDEFHNGRFETISSPAGAISSTAADMAKLMLVNLSDTDGVIMRPETFSQAQTNLYRMHSDFPGLAHGYIERNINGLRFVGHHGITIWYRALLLLLPEKKFGTFMVANSPGGSQLQIAFNQALMDRYYPKEVSTIQAAEGFSARANDYAGRYRSTRYNSSTLGKVGMLFTGEIKVVANGDALQVITDSGSQRYIELSPNLFRADNSHSLLAFKEDGYGKPAFLAFDHSVATPAHKLHFWESNRIHLTALIVCLALFFVVAMMSLLRYRRIFELAFIPRLVEIIQFSQSVLYVIFAIGFYLLMVMGETSIYQPWPAGMSFVLSLPVFAAILTLMSGIAMSIGGLPRSPFVLIWVKQFALLLTSIIFLAILFYWNSLGWKL